MRVAVYARISSDPNGESTATARQLEDCTAYAERQGWDIEGVYEDSDVSAYQPKAKRPEFEKLLAAIRTHAVDGLIAWRMDRIARQPRDLVRLDAALEEGHAFLVTAQDGIDTRQHTGRFVSQLLVSLAQMESSNTSIRIRRALAETAAKGRPSPGGARAYGFNETRTTLVPTEAAVLKEAAERILAGEGLRTVCRDFERRGILGTKGKAMRPSGLRRILTSALVGGMREYDGKFVEGDFPAILSPEDVNNLRQLLNAPDRRNAFATSRAYLLSGFAYCGRCGSKLIARPRGDGTKRYVCASGPGRPGCGRLARLAPPVDEVVAEAIFEACDGVSLKEYIERPNGRADALLAAIRTDEEALEELSRDHFVDRKIDRSEYYAARDPLAARLEMNRQQRARANGRSVATQVQGAGEEVRKRWDSRPLEWQRSVVGALIEKVVIEPATTGPFDPELVRIVWRF